MMDLNRALRTVTRTGKVMFGADQAKRAIESKEAKLIVLAENCPDEFLREQTTVPSMNFKGTNVEMGAACGKPFSISALTVLDAGDSQILQ